MSRVDLFAEHEPDMSAVLSGADLRRAYWRVRHLCAEAERRDRYWSSVCDALERAYAELDDKSAALDAAKLALLEANERLAARIEEQVGALRLREKRIDELYDQLQTKVNARSRELLALAQTLPRPELRPGDVLDGSTRIIEPLGAGGTGLVYRANDPRHGGEVAVKVLRRPGSRDVLERFMREAVTSTCIRHPSVVRTLHVDVTDGGMPYLVMELVVGRSLRALLVDHGRLPVDIVVRFGAELASALAAAHDAGVVHRDVKPGNVMVTPAEPGLRVLDFGISKLIREGESDPLTLDGRIVGTPLYLAPEQIRGPSCAGPEVDVYGAGVTLFELLVGCPPFPGPSVGAILDGHLHASPPPLRGVPSDIAELVAAALAKAPEARPTSRELALRLDALATSRRCAAATAITRSLLAVPAEVTRDATRDQLPVAPRCSSASG